MIDMRRSLQELWAMGDGPTRAYLLYLYQGQYRNQASIPQGTADSHYTNWTDMAHYRWYFRGE